MRMSEIELKFCPFCGKSARLHSRVNKNGIRVYVAECKNCCSKSNWYSDPERAAQSWNGRVIGFTKRNRADS